MKPCILLACAALLAAACAGPGEREADELADLRERASAGVEAVERFCTARDSAIVQVERGGPGAEVLLEEVLRAPVVLDDYCEDFRFHEHEDESHADEPASTPAAARDTAAADSVMPSGS